ncbi:MAG TPA: hypothetical protein VF657_22595 [Actinoplanes sp.]
MAELPADAYQLVAILHPNLVQGHGPFQVRAWFADCLRAGLVIVPPDQGWQAALIAADLVIGDHGSVTTYGAALGKPVLLAEFPDKEVAPGTAVHRLGVLAPRLQLMAPLRRQVEDVLGRHEPARYRDVAELVSSVPGETAQRLRELFYNLLDRTEPAGEAMTHAFPGDALAASPRPQLSAARVVCDVDVAGRVIRLERFPAELPPQLGAVPPRGQTHVAVHHAHPGWHLQRAAEVVFAYDDEIDDPKGWRVQMLRDRPHCTVAATLGERDCVLRHRRRGRLNIAADARVDPATLASAALAWLDNAQPGTAEEPVSITVDIGECRTEMSITWSGDRV